MTLWNKLTDELVRQVWHTPVELQPWWRRALIHSARMLHVVARDLGEGQLNLRAMSLVYTTLLSLVPLLAFSFSVLKGLGLHNKLEPLLYSSLETLGPKGAELGQRIMDFVENVRADILGSIGLAILIFLIISLVKKVESAFNHVWRVTEPRSFAQRFGDYLSVIMIGPLLIALSISITATMSSHQVVQDIIAIEPFGSLFLLFTRLLPYLIVIGVFTFIYMYVPNTRVRLWPALAGAIVGGIAWQTAGWVFTNYIANSGNYIAIYSSFAIVFTFMIWLYLSWAILLVGAQVAFYIQNPRYILKSRSRLLLSNSLREQLALEIMYRVATTFRNKTALWNMESLSEQLHIPGESLDTITSRLESRGLLLVTDSETADFVPGTDLAEIRIADILAAVRETNPGMDHDEQNVPFSAPVNGLFGKLNQEMELLLGSRTLRDLLDERD